MESIIKDVIVDMLWSQNWLNMSQHGFVSGRSCLTNLLETFEAWTRILDQGFGIDVIFLDYRKAFDTVPHTRLLKKLEHVGLSRKMLNWIKSFLTSRKMRVFINGSFSEWADVLSGVPQGSVLGPILFLIFINDLPDWISNSMKMFADDTKIWRAIKAMEDGISLQNDLDKLVEWTKIWLLKFNPDKCKVMKLGHNTPFQYSMEEDGQTYLLQETTEEKDLGINVCNNLKFGLQCFIAAKKAMSVLGLIRRHFRRIDKDDFKILYNCYVRPHVEYCIQA